MKKTAKTEKQKQAATHQARIKNSLARIARIAANLEKRDAWNSIASLDHLAGELEKLYQDGSERLYSTDIDPIK